MIHKVKLLAILLACSLQAETYLHLTSYHSISPDHGSWNNKNYGISYRSSDTYKVGVYKNSDYKTTMYVGYDYELYKGIGVQVALGTGYEQPIGGSIYYEYKALRLDLLPIVTPKERLGVAIGLSLKL